MVMVAMDFPLHPAKSIAGSQASIRKVFVTRTFLGENVIA
jgi:hypothetical protein